MTIGVLLLRKNKEGPIIQGILKNDAYWIFINRPDKLNALNLESWKELGSEIKKGCESDAVALVITGRGRAFSSGDDIKDLYSLKSYEEAHNFFKTIWNVLKSIIECEKPVIAAVNGLALGGGSEILIVSDIVVAARTAWISFPEVSLGLLPPFFMSIGPYVIGIKRTKFLSLTGQRLSAEEARQYGIVDLVVEDARLSREVEALIEDLKSYPQKAIRSIKKLCSVHLKKLEENVDMFIDELSKLTQEAESKKKMEYFLLRRRK